MVSGLKLKSLIHFELTLIYGVRRWFSFPNSMCWRGSAPHPTACPWLLGTQPVPIPVHSSPPCTPMAYVRANPSHVLCTAMSMCISTHKTSFCPDWCGSVSWASFPHIKRSPVQFPVRALAWTAGGVPGWDVREATDSCFSPSLSPFLPLSLKINK